MPVSAAEVAELRAAGLALPPGGDVDTTLTTFAEIIGYTIHGLREMGADRDEILHSVELVLRAAEVERESLREARDTLHRLGYGDDLAKVLTQVARKAKPKPPTFAERMRLQAKRRAAK